jgi:CoA:oxalate CoA-transferase
MTRSTVLDGLTVVESTASLTGALCGRLLAELGADVVLAEPPSGHPLRSLDDDGHFFETVAVGKRSVVVEAWSDRIGTELLGGAEVFLTDQHGVDASVVAERNPDAIYCAVSPFGRDGPNADRDAEDPTVQAASGITATTGFPDRPPAITAAPIAAAFGAIVGCGGVLVDLYEGASDPIDASAQDAVLPLLTTFLPEHLVTGDPVEAIGNRHPIVAPWNTYEAADDWVFFAGLTDRDWERFLTMAGREDLADDPRFETAHKRRQNVDEIDAIIGDWIGQHTVEEVIDATERHDLTAAPIHDVREAFADENLDYRDMVLESSGHTIAGSPLAMSETPGRVAGPAPDIGGDGGA